MNRTETIGWDDESASIVFVDQTLLPARYATVACRSIPRLAKAIRRLEIRGAPALGIAGASGIALAAVNCRKKEPASFLSEVRQAGDLLKKTRPTAINLAWGIDRVLGALTHATTVEEAQAAAVAEAKAVAREDEEVCYAMGGHGAALIPDGATVLTHCNAGALASREWGTALGVIRSAIESGKQIRVIACETRPLLQGARLTAWELFRDGIDVTVITDSAAAFLMRRGRIDCTIVGADRITRDAVFNKIGTYMHAVCCRHHGIPFYVAAPRSTFDPTLSEATVTVEERGRDELARFGTKVTVPDKVPVLNYAFDATPLELVRAVITEKGVYLPPIDIPALLAE